MSQELERVYTINLGKVKISQSQHRATRAINMIREFARHHMKVETIKIEEDLAREVWARGARSPPRKVRVRMSKTEEGYVLVSRYDDAESKVVPEKETKKVSDKVEEPAKDAAAEEEPAKDAAAEEEPAKDAAAEEEPAKDAAAEEEPAKDAAAEPDKK